MSLYVLSRTTNNRPSAQHEVKGGHDTLAICGIDMQGWSRYYMPYKLPVIYCMRCAKITKKSGAKS